MKPSQQYISKCREIIDLIEQQYDQINQVADWFSETILAGRMVHLFGSGHSRIMVE